MTRADKWRDWWFADAPATRLAIVRIVVGGFALHYLGTRVDMLAAVARTDPTLFEPVGVASWLAAPLAPAVADGLLAVTLVANLAFILGLWHRVSGPAFGLLLLTLLSYRNSWAMVYHSDNVLVLHALVLGLTRSADALSIDAWWRGHRAAPSWRYGWPLRLACGLAVSTYFLAGVAKVLGPLGWAWAGGDAMVSQILADGLRKELLGDGASALAFSLHDRLYIFALLGIGTLVLELGAPLAMVHPRAGRAWALAAFGMHWGVWAVMDIYFRYQMAGVLFLPFFRVDRLVSRAGAWWGRAAAPPSIAGGGMGRSGDLTEGRPVVIFDGRCRFCRAQIDMVRRLDVTRRLAFVSLHDASVAAAYPDLKPADLMQRLYVVDGDGTRRGGAAALRYITRRLPLLWGLMPLLHVPGSLPLWDHLYHAVARRRYWFGQHIDCPDDVCGRP